MRIGQGYDVHRLAEGRELILGGVKIPFEKGLLGHSDADVLIHAVMDALLGAAALGDIGQHFPDTDPAYEGISSAELLKRVGEILEERGYVVENIDATIIAQRPKLAAYRLQMAENIAAALKLDAGRVSVKATTEEGLGFTGAGEGIAAQAVCLLTSFEDYAYDDRMGAVCCARAGGGVGAAGGKGTADCDGGAGSMEAGSGMGTVGCVGTADCVGVAGGMRAACCAGCPGCAWNPEAQARDVNQVRD